MIASILEYAALAFFYSVLAATVLETLLRLWRVRDPTLAIWFRLAILAIPPGAPLLFSAVDLGRGSEPFRRQMALLDLRNWLGPESNFSHPGWILLLAVMATTTLLLVVLETAGFARHLLGEPATASPLPAIPERLQAAINRLSGRGIQPPRVLAVTLTDPTAWMAGLRCPTVLVSTSLVETLDDEELECALAHETAHVARRDLWLGWLIFSLRLVSFYNPVALFTFHQISHDTERVCDAEATAVTGMPLALASALVKVYQPSCAVGGWGQRWTRRIAGRAAALEDRARRALVEDRVERLVHPESFSSVSWPGLRLALAVTEVLLLTYLVV